MNLRVSPSGLCCLCLPIIFFLLSWSYGVQKAMSTYALREAACPDQREQQATASGAAAAGAKDILFAAGQTFTSCQLQRNI